MPLHLYTHTQLRRAILRTGTPVGSPRDDMCRVWALEPEEPQKIPCSALKAGAGQHAPLPFVWMSFLPCKRHE